jgi:hypothetical protein
MTFACRVNKARIYTLRICYNYRCPTATMAGRTRLNVALYEYVYLLSCYYEVFFNQTLPTCIQKVSPRNVYGIPCWPSKFYQVRPNNHNNTTWLGPDRFLPKTLKLISHLSSDHSTAPCEILGRKIRQRKITGLLRSAVTWLNTPFSDKINNSYTHTSTPAVPS